ncbi:uncharacterized protein [Chironomus tepperi]|uniref:uncharacterized protein n=1 Tax=Chironomus tepperi TaxID=113505 RepID=UPI00391F6CA3
MSTTDSQIPLWMDDKFIMSAISHYENNPQAKVLQYSIEIAKKSGGNQSGSAVYRSAIIYCSNSIIDKIFTIIKTQPVVENAEKLEDVTAFNVETSMYKILSKIQVLMQSIGDSDVLCPRLIFQSMEPQPVIFLEDVHMNGFDYMIDTIPEDFEFSKMIARRLGKFHAGSYYLNKIKQFNPAYFTFSIYEDYQCINMLFDKPLRIFIEVLSSWIGYEKYVEPLKAFRKNFASLGLKSYKPHKGSTTINVLNHGDFHSRNVLFRRDMDGTLSDMIMLDFQTCVFATPAIDLTYALYNFVSDSNRQKHRDEFIAIYHHQFVETLKQLGHQKHIPTLMDLQIEMLRNGNLQVITAICLKYLSYFDYKRLEPEDFTNGMRSIKVKAFNSDGFKKMISEELPRFLYSGII